MWQKRSKYGNVKTIRGFHSKAEERRYDELAMLQKAGRISDLKTQVPFEIVVNDVKICKYIADYTYVLGESTVIEDCKGFLTDVYRLKKKLMKAVHGIDILESGIKRKVTNGKKEGVPGIKKAPRAKKGVNAKP